MTHPNPDALPLKNFWYVALPSHRLKPGKVVEKTLLGEPVLLGRTREGKPFALRNICPHRGMPLHCGAFDGNEIACSYHGWRFDSTGRCTGIPSLVAPQDAYAERIRVKTYPCEDIQGNVWIFIPSSDNEGDPPPVPRMPDMGDAERQQVHCSLRYPLSVDNAAFTLMDPVHLPYVHSSMWLRRGPRKLKLKEKSFEPSPPHGWRMKRHAVPRENYAYRLFGQNVTTEIDYQLPGSRIEHIRGERHSAVSLLTITPLTEHETEIHQSLYWTFRSFAPLRPVFHCLIHRFLDQDRRAALRQKQGLAHAPTQMLLGDGDRQALWYHRLKRAWLRAEADRQPFENPIQAETLRWRS